MSIRGSDFIDARDSGSFIEDIFAEKKYTTTSFQRLSDTLQFQRMSEVSHIIVDMDYETDVISHYLLPLTPNHPNVKIVGLCSTPGLITKMKIPFNLLLIKPNITPLFGLVDQSPIQR
mgnify:CR=1 FL=1